MCVGMWVQGRQGTFLELKLWTVIELWKNSKCLTIEPSFQPESPDLCQREENEKSHFFVNRLLKGNRTAVVGGIYVVLRTPWDGFSNASSLSGNQVLDPISTIKQASSFQTAAALLRPRLEIYSTPPKLMLLSWVVKHFSEFHYWDRCHFFCVDGHLSIWKPGPVLHFWPIANEVISVGEKPKESGSW